MSFNEVRQKLFANPVYTLTNAVTFVGGVCVAVKGVMLTTAAVSTAASLASVAKGIGIFLVGAYVVVGAILILKKRILDQTFNHLQQERKEPIIVNIINALESILLFNSMLFSAS